MTDNINIVRKMEYPIGEDGKPIYVGIDKAEGEDKTVVQIFEKAFYNYIIVPYEKQIFGELMDALKADMELYRRYLLQEELDMYKELQDAKTGEYKPKLDND